MKENVPILSNVVVIGDEQRFLTMLVTLRCEVKLKDSVCLLLHSLSSLMMIETLLMSWILLLSVY